MGAASMGVPRRPVHELAVHTAGEPVVWVSGRAASSCGFAGYTAKEPVVVPTEVCKHEAPLVMSPVLHIPGDGMADCAHLKYGSTCC